MLLGRAQRIISSSLNCSQLVGWAVLKKVDPLLANFLCPTEGSCVSKIAKEKSRKAERMCAASPRFNTKDTRHFASFPTNLHTIWAISISAGHLSLSGALLLFNFQLFSWWCKSVESLRKDPQVAVPIDLWMIDTISQWIAGSFSPFPHHRYSHLNVFIGINLNLILDNQHQILHFSAAGLLLLSHLYWCPEEFHLTPRQHHHDQGTWTKTLREEKWLSCFQDGKKISNE